MSAGSLRRALACLAVAGAATAIACGSDTNAGETIPSAEQRDACAKAGGSCMSEDTSGCTGKAYPYCLPPPGKTYCSWLGGGELPVDCGAKRSCCLPRPVDGGTD